MSKLEDIPRGDWEDAGVDVSLVPALPRSLAQSSPR